MTHKLLLLWLLLLLLEHEDERGISKIASRTRYIIKIYCQEQELSHKNVFSCLLNTVNDGAKVMERQRFS